MGLPRSDLATHIRLDRVHRESLDPCPTRQRTAGLVERNVPVLADAAQEQLDAAQLLDLGLVPDALGLEGGCRAVEDVDVGRGDVDCKKAKREERQLRHPKKGQRSRD